MRISIQEFLLFSLSCLIAFPLLSQDANSTGQQAIEKVFRVLSKQEVNIPNTNKIDSLLMLGAWESLAYIDMTQSFQINEESLQEAVPDYYQFKANKLYFQLINPQNHNEYGYQGQLHYVVEGEQISLRDLKTKEEKDRWQIIYLDANYLALEMDQLRVFLSHTRPQY